jgi:hypothetical protein
VTWRARTLDIFGVDIVICLRVPEILATFTTKKGEYRYLPLALLSISMHEFERGWISRPRRNDRSLAGQTRALLAEQRRELEQHEP